MRSPLAHQLSLFSPALWISATLPFQLKREIDDGDCVLLPLELPWLSLNYGFISKRGRTHSPAAKAFMEKVRQIERDLPA
jgi:DNA-binding transcriptional LysR family regulator